MPTFDEFVLHERTSKQIRNIETILQGVNANLLNQHYLLSILLCGILGFVDSAVLHLYFWLVPFIIYLSRVFSRPR